jgi:glycosyltransferase involved in cell wall biosynthesis
VLNLPFQRVAVLTSHLATGDAVSNDVVGMSEALVRSGMEAKIFAGSWDIADSVVAPLSEIHEFLNDAADLLIYHYSIEWRPGLELLASLSCRTAIKYHNVTPSEFFVGISPWHEEKCRAGREGLLDIVKLGCDLYLSDSEFNRQELIALGVSDTCCLVVPPFHHIDRLQAVEPDMDVLDEYRDGKTNILMVGRVAPNKGHLALIEAFAIYHHDYNRESRLFIVGKEEQAFEIYSKRLRELTDFLVIENSVLFVGEASDSELKSYYLLSSAFAIASEHEGFCVPLVEAMSMKVPAIAYASSAIPATIGGAGLLLSERDPRLMAQALDSLIRNEQLNFDLGLMGWRRYERNFSNDRIEAELIGALGKLDELPRRNRVTGPDR